MAKCNEFATTTNLHGSHDQTMSGPILYSTNPWIAHEFAVKYLGGKHFAWCSECYDPIFAPPGSAGASVAPSSSPHGIFQALKHDCEREDKHSDLIKRYRKTFKRLAADWLSTSRISQDQYDEIIAVTKGPSWRIWRPVLYVIPREPIEAAGRLNSVPYKDRAGYGPELQITDLDPSEFDLLEVQLK
jgi:hypothetical protein